MHAINSSILHTFILYLENWITNKRIGRMSVVALEDFFVSEAVQLKQYSVHEPSYFEPNSLCL